ncbi:MAG TPA: glucosaminidase domain-containing protein [Mycobacteriales bacterium]|nr:glucosaminidase domain-containing protein [Mycobacteriales bacterium]
MKKGVRSAIARLTRGAALLALIGSAVMFMALTPGTAQADTAQADTVQADTADAVDASGPFSITEFALTDAVHTAFIAMAGKSAQSSQQKYGVPAAVTIGQAILESNWGTSALAVKTNNHFGMKCANNVFGPIATGCASSPTWECANDKGCYGTIAMFRVYSSVADSFADHGDKLFLADRYRNAFKFSNDPDQFIREIHKAGYATDPGYSDKVIKLMKQYNLYKFDSVANKVSTDSPK